MEYLQSARQGGGGDGTKRDRNERQDWGGGGGDGVWREKLVRPDGRLLLRGAWKYGSISHLIYHN